MQKFYHPWESTTNDHDYHLAFGNFKLDEKDCFISNDEYLFKYDAASGQLTSKTNILNELEPSKHAVKQGQFNLFGSRHLLSSIYCHSQDCLFAGSQLIKTDKLTGSCKSVYKAANEKGYKNYLKPAVSRIQGKDTLLYFLNIKVNSEEQSQNTDLHCYSLSRRELIWSQTNIEPKGVVNGDFIKLDKASKSVIVQGVNISHSFNWDNGDINWQTMLPGFGSNISNYIISGNHLVVGGNTGIVAGINKYNGQIEWTNNDSYGFIQHLTSFKNHVFVSSCYLIALDVKNGEMSIKLEDPDGDCFKTNAAISDDERQLFIANSNSLLAYSIE